MKGGRGLVGCENCIRSEENSLGWYLENATEELSVGAKIAGVIETDETVCKSEFRKRCTDEGLRKWRDIAMHGQLLRDMPETTDAEQTWSWLISFYLKVQTEALICATQEQALRPNYMKHHVDQTAASLKVVQYSQIDSVGVSGDSNGSIGESECVLCGWLIERGIFIIFSAFLLDVI